MMPTANDLPARLREHAAEHQDESDADGDDWTLYGRRDGRLARDLREAAERLESISERAATTVQVGHGNGAERLCRILYGRSAEIGDTIGGLDAQMLHDAAAELERMGWRDIATAPKDGRRLLLATPSGKIADGYWSLHYKVWSWPYVMVEPTHWMHAPEPPARGGA